MITMCFYYFGTKYTCDGSGGGLWGGTGFFYGCCLLEEDGDEERERDREEKREMNK